MSARGIRQEFIVDLREGKLSDIYEFVCDDDNLSLEIRKDYINIYYKGGNLLKIDNSEEVGKYSFEFDTEYCADEDTKKKIKSWKTADAFTRDNLIFLKDQIDSWLAKDTAERKFQHEALLNCKSIADIEYQVGGNKKGSYRIDMILLQNDHVVLVENKSGIGSISSRISNSKELKAGIRKHYRDFVDLATNPDKRKDLIDSLNNIQKNKFDLMLIPEKKTVSQDAKIDFLFVLHDYNYESTLFSREVKDIKEEFGDSIDEYDTRVQFIGKNDTVEIDFDKALSVFGELPVKMV